MKAIFFDLDGTLLPMDQDAFVRAYFGALAAKLAPHGYDPKALVAAIWKGTEAMVRNDGSVTNEEAFWRFFATVFGEQSRKDEPLFDAFYHNEFQQVANACGFAPEAQKIVSLCKQKGLRCVLATNPIFPAVATLSRIRWAGLDAADFEWITTYENSCHCKPNPAYYQDLLDRLNLNPADCVMVGNDVGEDMIARKLGMKVFLLTDCLINKKEEEISAYPHGGFQALEAFILQEA